MPALVAATVAGLGTPDIDGALGTIRTANAEEALVWNLEEQVWIGSQRVTMRTNENVGIGTAGSPGLWKYPNFLSERPISSSTRPRSGSTSTRCSTRASCGPAGLRLQEHLSGEIMQQDDPGVSDTLVALAWYPLSEGDQFLSPLSYNHGVKLVRDKDIDPTRYRWCSTGWQNNVTTGDEEEVIEEGNPSPETNHSPPPDCHFYPEIYTYGPSLNMRRFTAMHRWVGGAGIGASGSFEIADKYPPWGDVRGWWRAEHIAVADGQGVSAWADFSSRGRELRQPTSGKRPIVMRSDLGSGNTKRFVRFDGSNDLLGELVAPIPLKAPEESAMDGTSLLPSYSMFAVMRQRAAGPSGNQVWFGRGTSGSPLFFRSSNAGDINLWLGGTDIVYDTGSWPMPWTILSFYCDDGGTTTIWENLTQKVSGNPGSIDWNTLTVGNSADESLPSAIDVAEIIFCQGEMTSGQRTAIVNYLNAEYGIF